MPARKGLLAPQNTFLDTIATRFDGTHSNFVLGNAKITRIYPIVYCSDGFCELTGYSRAQIMQKSCACNFLYGQKTDVQHRDAISKSLERKQELKLEVILYKSSGTPFWCLLDIVPIQDEKHEVVLFLCSHKDITKQKLHEQQQRVALHHQMHLQQAAAAAAAAAADHQPNQQHNLDQSQPDKQATRDNQNRNQLVPICDAEPNDKQHQLDNQHQPVQSPQEDGLVKDSNCGGQQMTLQQQQEHDDQQALISMEEFCIDDMDDDDDGLDGDQDDEHHDKHTANQYSRRRSRAVLYQLSGHYGYRRSVNMKSKLKLNNRMTIPEYKTTTIEKQKFILSHYGLGKSCWDWLILIVSFYVAIVVPYNATFKEKRSRVYFGDDEEALNAGFLANSKNQSTSSVAGQPRQSSPYGRRHEDQVCQIDSIDIFVEVVFIIDVLLNFRTTFVNRKGEVVTRPKIICRHYFRGWFIVDACAALPFDLLCGLNLLSRSLSNIDLNLLKLIRLLRLARLLQKMDRYSQYSYIILTLLMLIFSLLAHWCACIWYVIAMEEIGRHPPEWKLGWIHQLSDKLGYNVVNATDMASSYVTALYFTTSSLTSVGFGNVSANTNAEKIFSIVIMLIGALMHAVVFGNVTALIRVMYARRSNYQTRLRDLKDFFRLHQLPKDLQQRMSDYFQTTWSLNHGIETYEILKDFPEELRGDVSLHLHREVLSLPIFASAPQGFLKSLARHIESKFCCPTEYLIHRGDALSYLYLVCNGSMEVLQDNMVVGILGKGDLVGYDVNAMLSSDQQASGQFGGGGGGVGASTGAGSGNQVNKIGQSMGSSLVKSSSDLKALTYCDLKCIHIGGLLEVLKLYPEFADTFHDEIIHDLSFNLREQHEEHDEDVDVLDDEEEDDEDDEDDDDDDDDDDEDDDDEDGDGDDDGNDDQGGANHGGEGADSGHHDDDAKDGETRQSSPPPPAQDSHQPQSPPGAGAANNQMGRLLRSITENGGNQVDGVEQSDHIGRYDYDDDELVGAIVADDGGEDEEDDDDDDDDDDNSQDGDDVGRAPTLNGRNNNDSSDDDANPSRANNPGRTNRSKTGNGANIGGDWQSSSQNRRGSKQLSSGDNGGQRRQQRMNKRPIESTSLENYSNCATDQLDSLDQDEEAVDEELDRYDAASLLNERFGRGESGIMASFGTKLARRVRDDDWEHFSHSYDGLVSSSSGVHHHHNHHQAARRTGSQGTQQQHHQQHREQHLVLGTSFGGQTSVRTNDGSGLSKTKGKNKSDETVLELAQLKRTTTAPTVANGGGVNPTRLKSAIGAQGQSRPNKPPISFDLSRNTTAIIDRRRRSAGCIQRLNLISTTAGSNQLSGGVRMAAGRVLSEQPSRNICEGKRCHSSSLININENEPMTIRDRQMVRNQQMQLDKNKATSGPVQKSRRRSLDKVTLMQQTVDGAATVTALPSSSVSRQAANSKAAFKASYSNHDLQQIDAHITASVKKLRQEFKQELNKAIESLARLMLERDTGGTNQISLDDIVEDRTSMTAKQVANKRNKQQQSTMSEFLTQALDKSETSSPRMPLRVAQRGQLQRRETATELSMDRQDQSVGVCRSISSNSFTGRPTSIVTDQTEAELQNPSRNLNNNFLQRQAIVTIKQQQPKHWPMSLTSGTSSGSSSSSSQPVDGLVTTTTTSLALVLADSCPVGLVQPKQQQQQQILCKMDDNTSRPISQSSTSGQEQRPSSDTCRKQETCSSEQTNGQSVLMLNASDNDSGRSTCSVNSSGAIMAASLARSPILSTMREPIGLSQSSDLTSRKVINRIPSGGRAAKMLVKTGERVDSSTFGQDESYTINIGEQPVDVVEQNTQ